MTTLYNWIDSVHEPYRGTIVLAICGFLILGIVAGSFYIALCSAVLLVFLVATRIHYLRNKTAPHKDTTIA